MGDDAEALVEILVERHDLQPIEHRHQPESDDQLTDGEAGDHLHVGKRIGGDRTGNGDEGDARHGGADHGQSGHIPRGAAVAGEKTGVVGAAAGKPGHDEQYGNICQNGEYDGGWGHRRTRSEIKYPVFPGREQQRQPAGGQRYE